MAMTNNVNENKMSANIEGAVKLYQKENFILVPIEPSKKSPASKQWSLFTNCIKPNDQFPAKHQIGIAHAYSRTVAIDVDDYNSASRWLMDYGIDLDSIFNDPTSVKINSGIQNHGKLIYRLPPGIKPPVSWTFKDGKHHILQFRCATRSKTTLQDVLPPSIHPTTGMPYTWDGDFRNIPIIPDYLLSIWQDNLNDFNEIKTIGDVSTSEAELESALQSIDPDIDHDDWVKIGMALHSASPDYYYLFDEWSSNGSKYKGQHETSVRWKSFKNNISNGVTILSLFKMARTNGWKGYFVKAADVFGDVPIPDGINYSDRPDTIVDINNTLDWDEVFDNQEVKQELHADIQEDTKQDNMTARPMFIKANEGLTAGLTAPQWLIKGVLEKKKVGVLYGETCSYKSFISLDWSLCIALGLPWKGRVTRHSGSVLYICGEGQEAIWRRVEAWRQHYNATHVDEENFTEITREMIDESGFAISRLPVDMMDHETLKPMEGFVMSENKAPSLIVIDTYAANTTGDENSAGDTTRFINVCNRYRDAWGCTMLIVHHSGHTNKERMRGSSSLPAGVDFTMGISKGEHMQVSVDLEKMKDSTGDISIGIQMKVHPIIGLFDEDGQPVTSLVTELMDDVPMASRQQASKQIKLRSNQREILAACEDIQAEIDQLSTSNPGFSFDMLIEAVRRISENPDYRIYNIRRSLNVLIKVGFVEILDESEGETWYKVKK